MTGLETNGPPSLNVPDQRRVSLRVHCLLNDYGNLNDTGGVAANFLELRPDRQHILEGAPAHTAQLHKSNAQLQNSGRL